MSAVRREDVMKTFIAIVAMALCASTAFAAPGVIIADGARLRRTPSLKGAELAQMKRGDLVEVAAESKSEEVIDGMRYPWVSITSNGKTGWVYGAYIVHGGPLYYDAKDGTLAWMDTRYLYSNTYKPQFNVINKKKKVDIRFDLEPQDYTTGYALSTGLKYVAIDAGTDVIGSIVIYSIPARRLVHRASYTRHRFEWVGQRLSYQCITYTGDGCLLWEEEVFDDGAVKKTGKKGKGEYHGSGKGVDPRCR